MKEYRAGALPIDETKSRGELIRGYLLSHPEIKYYIIADDEEDLLPEQLPHLIKTNASYGFLEPEYKRCVELYMKFKSGKNNPLQTKKTPAEPFYGFYWVSIGELIVISIEHLEAECFE